MAPCSRSVSKKVRKLDNILQHSDRHLPGATSSSTVKIPGRRMKTVGRKRSTRLRNREAGPQLDKSPTPITVTTPSPSPVQSPAVSPPREVPLCDDDGEIPHGEVEYFVPDPNRRFGQGPSLGAAFGKLNCHFGPHPRTKKKKTTSGSERLNTQPEPSTLPGVEEDPVPREPAPQGSVPHEGKSHTTLKRQEPMPPRSLISGQGQSKSAKSVAGSTNSRADAPPAMREDDEPEAPLLSSVHLHEFESAARRSQSPCSGPMLTPENPDRDVDACPSVAVAKKSIRKKTLPLPATQGKIA